MTQDENKDEKKGLNGLKTVGGDIVGTIVGIVVGVCCLCCVLPIVIWCMFIKATVDIAEANNMNNQNMNQQPMLGGGGETVVVEDARMEPMMGGY